MAFTEWNLERPEESEGYEHAVGFKNAAEAQRMGGNAQTQCPNEKGDERIECCEVAVAAADERDERIGAGNEPD